MFEFHIAREIRKKYQLETSLFATDGNVIFADFIAVRQFVFKINRQREAAQHIYPGEVNAAGLIDEIYHLILREYEEQLNPGVFDKALKYVAAKTGQAQLNSLLQDFVEKFPPAEIYSGNMTAVQYLSRYTNHRHNSAIALEEAMMVFLANFNPANKKMQEFFDENYLEQPALFRRMMDALDEFFRKEPPFGPQKQDIITLLKTPLLKAPGDLFAQLNYILENWKSILPETIRVRILKGKDLMKEDLQLSAGTGSAPTIAPTYKEGQTESFSIGKSGFDFAKASVKDYEEYEHFTPDTHWMPRVVVLAKNTYVWLDQLSKKYQYEIKRLDQVPDEELDLLAKWHFNGLWLIGIWERSNASKRIKHIMGNTDAVSSAYSLFDYEIAADLGGEAAYQNLNTRAKARGIRLASDMVPNHTGLHSKWVIENPDYFIQTHVSPFPGYSFTGENLSQHPDIEIRIDDGYYNRSDAAVVFQRIDRRNSDVRYIYHGNDGTNMPWNDTAQLDMLKKEVREAVIQKIFDVARRFSIIRFDAAMTLAKKHFSRLWYPRPGSGGDIPSRADFALSEEEFDAMFPVEFWREVVDRINNDMPETLLLAEAFWLMEGYFVRTLGMHRVYNSAFMHMLKNEENDKYRDLITNTLEFEPEILKRYVNFMSNPDEETAIRQFGSDDKYFGVCVLMSTLPGLPMFAHGQIEGYTEKYGMEYQRAYYNEQPNSWLVERHEREIFPLTQKRHIFSEVDYFNIFDFVNEHGHINENVYAYTNRAGHERALVLFNNRYESATGSIKISAPKLSKQEGGKTALTFSLGQALSLNHAENFYYIFREHISGLEFLRSGKEIHENGFSWGLQGFEYRIFMDFTEVYDRDGKFARLHSQLNGAGVPDIREKLNELELRNVHRAFETLLSEESIQYIYAQLIRTEMDDIASAGPDFIIGKFNHLLEQLKGLKPEIQGSVIARQVFTDAMEKLIRSFDFVNDRSELLKPFFSKIKINNLDEMLVVGSTKLYRENMIILSACLACTAIREMLEEDEMEALALRKPLQNVLKRTGRGEKDIALDILLIGLLSNNAELIAAEADKEWVAGMEEILLHLLNQPQAMEFAGVNEYRGVLYFSKENYEELIDWIFALRFFHLFSEKSIDEAEIKARIIHTIEASLRLKEISGKTGYEFNKLQEILAAK